MASTTLTVVTAAVTGGSITAKTGVSTGETLTVSPSTAQGVLDFPRLYVRCENTSTTASVSLSLAAADDFSNKGIGAATITVGTATTVVIGGAGFEGARFLSSGGTIVFTQTGTGSTSWEAYTYSYAIDS